MQFYYLFYCLLLYEILVSYPQNSLPNQCQGVLSYVCMGMQGFYSFRQYVLVFTVQLAFVKNSSFIPLREFSTWSLARDFLWQKCLFLKGDPVIMTLVARWRETIITVFTSVLTYIEERECIIIQCIIIQWGHLNHLYLKLYSEILLTIHVSSCESAF